MSSAYFWDRIAVRLNDAPGNQVGMYRTAEAKLRAMRSLSKIEEDLRNGKKPRKAATSGRMDATARLTALSTTFTIGSSRRAVS